MTRGEIEAELERIERLAQDEEEPYGAADELYWAVLEEISESGCQDCGAAALATVALKARPRRFSRLCARRS